MSETDYGAAVAIVGMSGRFPGASSVDDLWANLLAGRPGLREVDDDELTRAGVSPARLANPAYVRVTGSLDAYDMFDAAMFGFSRREAESMDPQHRLFLECSWEALEHAGYAPTQVPGRVGVFAGCGYPDYIMNIAAKMSVEPGGALMLAIGTERDSLASLVSYKLDLRGPSITVQTFCSTSLVAVHLAAQSLLNYECEMALAGGSFVPLPQNTGYLYEEGGIYAPDGKVRAFDAGARGSVAGSGVSVVTLKRMADAVADGDHIEAVILGSAVNNDGRACAGYTAPGVDGQSEVMTQAMGFAGVKPETIGYVECHGTGTMLGDSIELAALAKAFPQVPPRPCVLGSLKPSIGHLDRASGTAALIRAALALRDRVLPGTPHFQTPNAALTAARDRFTVLTGHQPWPEGPHPRRAGVSAFGLGGTNAHLVLEEPPPVAPQERPGPHLLVLSARVEAALDAATGNLRRHLAGHTDLPLADVAYTLQQSRSHLPHRRAVICDDIVDAGQALADPHRWLTGEAQHLNPPVCLDLPDPAAVAERWWRELRAAAGRLLGDDSPADPAQPAFAAAVRALAAGLARAGVRFGQVTGPDPVEPLAAELAGEFVRDPADECPAHLTVRPEPGEPAGQWLLAAVARLWLAGTAVRWRALHSGTPRRVPLPTYPFQRRRYWIDAPANPFLAQRAPAEGRIDDPAKWTYQPAWRHAPAELTERSEQVRKAGPWLVLTADARGEAVVEQLRTAGAEVTRVRTGTRFAGTDQGDFTVRPGHLEDLVRLVAELDAAPRTVVHAFCLGAPAPARAHAGAPAAAADAEEDSGVESTLALVGALARRTLDQEVSFVAVTGGAASVAGAPPDHPAQAALAGLVPVLGQENPGWVCRHVDVDRPATAASTAALAAAIVGEAVSDHIGPIALRGTSRWVRDHDPRPLPAVPEPDGPLRPGATVLITGGLGHVGLILARHLAGTRGCRVVLTSRTALPPDSQWDEFLVTADPTSRTARSVRTLRELRRDGAEILALAADVADEPQMRAAVAAACARFGRIDLVVHAAGVSDPAAFGPAHLIDRAAGRSHLITKVGGFQTLHRVLAEHHPGGVPKGITLSSLSAVLGGLGLGRYAAANAALDAYTVAARAAGHSTWITVDWDTWRPAPDAPVEPSHAAIEFDMDPGEAVSVFERALAAIDHIDHLVISTGPLAARFEQWVIRQGQRGDGSDDGERDPRPELSTPYVEPSPGIEQTLAVIWARVLRLDRVGADDDFFHLGGNSVMAIELIALLRRELHVPVPTTALLGFPTVRGLAGQIEAATGSVDIAAGTTHE